MTTFGWKYVGQERPDFAEDVPPGKESVWDYPRPPSVARDPRRVRVRFGDIDIADTGRALRVMETASPPTFYIPATDIIFERLQVAAGSSMCEWKGLARYWSLVDAPELGAVAWDYSSPSPAFTVIARHLAFYPGRVECFVGGERVRTQPGGFYGGWVTDEVVGPFKGEQGTGHW